MRVMAKVTAFGFEATKVNPKQLEAAVQKAVEEIGRSIASASEIRRKEFEQIKRELAELAKRLEKVIDKKVDISVDVVRAQPPFVLGPASKPAREPRVPHASPNLRSVGSNADGAGLGAAHIKILSGLDEILAATGKASVRKEQLAAWTEYSPTSGGYANNLGTLRSAGAIDYPQPGYVAITEEGRKHSQPADTPASTDAMLAHAKRVLSGSEARLLDELHARYPEAMSKTELAERTGFSPTSGGYANNLGHMRTLGFIDYPEKGSVRASAWLFIERKNGEAA